MHRRKNGHGYTHKPATLSTHAQCVSVDAAQGMGKKKGRRGSLSRPGLLRLTVSLSLSALLVQACASGDIATVANLVTEKHADPFASDKSRRTPLKVACEAGHIEVVKFLMEREGASQALMRTDGTTPLHVAARAGNLDILKYLINEKGMDPFCRDKNGLTAAQYARNNRTTVALTCCGATESGAKRLAGRATSLFGSVPALGLPTPQPPQDPPSREEVWFTECVCVCVCRSDCIHMCPCRSHRYLC